MSDNANPQDDKDNGILEAKGQPFSESRDLGKLATVVAGVAVGAMIGAGAALLLAPASGDETRTAIRRRVRKLTRRERGVWQSLARALEQAVDEKAARSRLRSRKAEVAAAALKSAT